MTLTSFRNLAAVSAIAALSALALPASAQGSPTGGMQPRTQFGSSGYVGLNVGSSKFNAPCGTAAFGCDDSDRAWNIYGGSMFNDHFGLEIGYIDFGDMNRGGGETSAKGLNMSLVGKAPIGRSFGLYGKVGTTYGRTSTSAAPGGGVAAGSDNGFGLSYGLGVSYDFTPKVSAVLGWDSHDLRFAGTGRDTIRTTTVGIQYHY